MNLVDILVRGTLGGAAIVFFVMVAVFCWHMIKALIRALHPRSLGRAFAFVEKQFAQLLLDFKSGRDSGS